MYNVVGIVKGFSPDTPAVAMAIYSGECHNTSPPIRDWLHPSDLPDWLNEETYREKIQPRLSEITVPALSAALGLSEPYAAEIRAGRCLPHPRHWQTLARLVSVTPDE